MKYIVYITINTVNNKIYVGVHKTETPEVFDGYIGCGVNVNHPSTIKYPKTHFLNAVKKYGFKAFKRFTIAEYDSEIEALLLELIIVNEKFYNRADTYNMMEGGQEIHKDFIETYQFDLLGNLLYSFKSILDAATYNNYSELYISMAIKLKRSYNNYYWSNTNVIDISQYTKVSTENKLVYKFNTKYELVKVYTSTSEAAKDNDCTRENIRDAILNMSRAHNYYYSYNNTFNKTPNIDTKIYKYSMLGHFIESNTLLYYSELLNVKPTSFYKKANSGLILKGFQWNINNVTLMPDKSLFVNYGKPRKVGQYDLDGNLVKVFDTVTQCSKIYCNVKKVLNGKLDSTKGYVFRYIQ